MLEINSNPDRRDLDDINARAAAAAGVRIVINTDSHRVGGFAVARYGIATARRAWLTAAQVVNTLPWSHVQALRPRHRHNGQRLRSASRLQRTAAGGADVPNNSRT
jgi:DNA polymerase (family X)